ncbi:endonuclease/exonuclease/phosphatase family protein [Saccharomonospora piscinae]|uniref:endonuclease/exonuclease/phosphatase family protein n=1 Tax=Saccharomonospora piscinae TaxID=687388 RepID=UPI000465E5DD|nr:endonuclease/exonuclease/phosphatase family protein [Saccharomonospora piscinae]
MRRLGVSVLLAVSMVAVSAPSAQGSPVQSRDLTVATFNIHHGAGPDDELDLPHVAEVIAGHGMDVVGLQEVDRHWGERSEFVDQARWLGAELDMHVAFGANLDEDPAEAGQPRRQYGTAILSRYPIEASRNVPLPRPEGGEQRGLLEAVVLVRGVPLHFYSTHLQHDSRVERLAQADAINAVLADVEGPTVLVGDLNAEPGTPEIERLATHLADTWPAAGQDQGLTYPAEAPRTRIDYVFADDSVSPDATRVIDTTASDHRPVAVDVTVSGRPGLR